MTEVSATRLYLGNLPRNGEYFPEHVPPKDLRKKKEPAEDLSRSHSTLSATKADVETHFNSHGTGEITEIKLMNGFGFIEYKDAMDARDVVPGVFYHLTLSGLIS